MFCKHCGAEISEDSRFCPKCGEPLTLDAEDEAYEENEDSKNVITIVNNDPDTVKYSDKNRGIAIILCLLLGCLGAHRFYLGKIGTGFLYLVTLGLLGIGALVDFIRLLLNSMRDGENRPLK